MRGMLVFYEVGRGSEEGLHLSEGNKSPSVVSVDQRQTLSERDARVFAHGCPKKKTASQIICKTFFGVKSLFTASAGCVHPTVLSSSSLCSAFQTLFA